MRVDHQVFTDGDFSKLEGVENVPDGAITAAKIAAGAVGDSQVGTLSQSEITNLTTDLAGKVSRSGGDTLTGSYTIAGTLDTGFGPNELY